MTRPEAERLARIETLLEALPEMKTDIKAIRQDLDLDKADLAALKNRGIGLLVGVGMVGGTAGAGLLKIWQEFVG